MEKNFELTSHTNEHLNQTDVLILQANARLET